MTTEIALPGKTTPTSLDLPRDLTLDQWSEVGGELKRTEGSLQWWIGDWWAYGEQYYGERIETLVKNGMGDLSARDLGWVANKIEPSRRRDALSWSHHREVAALDAVAQDDLLQAAADSGWSRNQLRQAVKDWKARKREEPPEMPDERWSLIHSAVADLDIGDEPVDCIITDPPYPQKFLSAYSDLSAMAARALKPGGFCVVMTGQSYLPEVIERLGEHLRYQWTTAYLTPGGQAVQIWDRRVNTFWKPLLWFVNGEYDGDRWFGDVAKSDPNDNDKRFHHWGQAESGMADIVRRFTEAGDMILDPFCGGGTTGVVAVEMDRLFIGSDNDAECLITTKRRLEACKRIPETE